MSMMYDLAGGHFIPALSGILASMCLCIAILRRYRCCDAVCLALHVVLILLFALLFSLLSVRDEIVSREDEPPVVTASPSDSFSFEYREI